MDRHMAPGCLQSSSSSPGTHPYASYVISTSGNEVSGNQVTTWNAFTLVTEVFQLQGCTMPNVKPLSLGNCGYCVLQDLGRYESPRPHRALGSSLTCNQCGESHNRQGFQSPLRLTHS
ncbi:hypothetical protein Y1Q_0024622 [Alligator mississippiensis]|uniref:Uncharacterized protein n=1 Tax=Alligator mississippiensis TaxID=8496 RepID=A0A151NB29_ALLMI|nr:hypothetical protein Y1Q_0024622 [Alligator mississippiensis]